MNLFFRRHLREPARPQSRGGMFERYTILTDDGSASDYLLICAHTQSAVLIDAGGDADVILREIDAHRAHVRMIVLTHGHSDRWRALGKLRERLGAPIGISLDDVEMLPLTPNFALSDGQRLAFDAASLRVIHTPGHTPGSVCLLGDGNLFCGDTLLSGALAEADPAADPARLSASVRERILRLPGETRTYPAHGAPSTVGAARAIFGQDGPVSG